MLVTVSFFCNIQKMQIGIEASDILASIDTTDFLHLFCIRLITKAQLLKVKWLAAVKSSNNNFRIIIIFHTQSLITHTFDYDYFRLVDRIM